MPHQHDVIVVGGGPAGSVAALLLARAGVRVLLMDRARFPRAKPCGECLSPEATRLLLRLDLLDGVQALGPARLTGWRIVSPAGRILQADFAPQVGASLAIPRIRLDELLLHRAAAAGADVLDDVHVDDLLRGDGGAVVGVRARARGRASSRRARLVIGADGLRSVVARRARLIRRPPRRRKASVTLHVGDIGCGDRGEMHLGDGICVGLAPVDAGGTSTNVTLVVDAARHGRAFRADPHAFFLRAIDRLPRIPPHLRRELSARPALDASGPFDAPTRRITAPGLALVGDAAGYFDPFTGQGIYQAMASAEILARVASNALEHGDVETRSLDAYVRNRARLMRGTRALQRVIDAMLGGARRADLSIAALRRAPIFADAVLAATADSRAPATVLHPRALLDLAGAALPRKHATPAP